MNIEKLQALIKERGFSIIHYVVTKCSLVKEKKKRRRLLLNKNVFTEWTKIPVFFMSFLSVCLIQDVFMCILCLYKHIYDA